MTDETKVVIDENAGDETRVYEAGYHILSTVKEEELESVVAEVRALIEKAGGSLIAEGAPVSTKLAYTMYVNLGGKHAAHERAYFGWLKFEAAPGAAVVLGEWLEGNPNILRSIVFKTVREDTRASARPTMLREVKRTDTIGSTKRAPEEQKGAGEEVSEEALDKSLEELTA